LQFHGKTLGLHLRPNLGAIKPNLPARSGLACPIAGTRHSAMDYLFNS
jgi:hypothetical protein